MASKTGAKKKYLIKLYKKKSTHSYILPMAFKLKNNKYIDNQFYYIIKFLYVFVNSCKEFFIPIGKYFFN